MNVQSYASRRACRFVVAAAAIVLWIPCHAGISSSSGTTFAAPGMLREPRSPKVLNVEPAPERRPALDVLLLPSMLSRVQGNAAPAYLAAVASLPDVEPAVELIETPLEELREMLAGDPEKSRWIEENQWIVEQLGVASRYEYCRWDWDLSRGWSLLLPHLSPLRAGARLVAASARVDLARGDLDAAVEKLTTLFAMARDIAGGPTLIELLVGSAVAGHALDHVELLVQQPGAPNLYWALSHLGQPLLIPRRAWETERSILYLPTGDPRPSPDEAASWSAEHWLSYGRQLAETVSSYDGRPSEDRESVHTLFAGIGVLVYPRARAALRSEGISDEEIDRRPIPRVVVEYLLDHFDTAADEQHKWLTLPYWEAREQLDAASRTHEELYEGVESIAASVLVHPVGSAAAVLAAVDRRIAALRLIEAFRATAAAGPIQPDTSPILPVPTDPTTGRSFRYAIKDGVVVINGEKHPSDRDVLHMVYELRVVKPGGYQ